MNVLAHSSITVTVDRHGKPIGLGSVESSDYYATKAGCVSVDYVRADQLTGAVATLQRIAYPDPNKFEGGPGWEQRLAFAELKRLRGQS